MLLLLWPQNCGLASFAIFLKTPCARRCWNFVTIIMDSHTSYLVDVGHDWLPEPGHHMAHPASFGAFVCVWLPYSHHLADDANYSNLRWLWVFFLLVLFCLLVFSHICHQTMGYVHSKATVVGMPTWWLGWTCPTLPWEPWTCLSNLCSYLPPGMIVVSLQVDHKLVCS